MRTSTGKFVKRARALRRAMTLPEVLLWQVLRGRPGNHKFRHQHSAGPYVLDFYCVAASLCIEVDGKAHEMGANPARDARRDAWLAEQGIRTLRIPAEEILRDIEPVVVLIGEICASRSPSTMNRCAVSRTAQPCPGDMATCSFAGPPPLEIEGRNKERP